jgi:hypothetical protein
MVLVVSLDGSIVDIWRMPSKSPAVTERGVRQRTTETTSMRFAVCMEVLLVKQMILQGSGDCT